mmetsp:Transcript_30671/g.64268  ORF Transcript_30671/g.64268 Transcript_30671/m.64268 type:complete len:103 (-) Transcript_30671:928-1236(-)
MNPKGNKTPALAFGSQCHITTTESGFNQKHKSEESINVRVTLRCRTSSPSPPPGEEYRHLTNANETIAATSVEDAMAECDEGERAMSDQLGWRTTPSQDWRL